MVHSNLTKEQFIYPRSRFYGSYTPENLAFDANLQKLAQKISIVSALHTGGKISSTQALKQIEEIWCLLEQSHKTLSIHH